MRGCAPDIRVRLGQAHAQFNKMCHVWTSSILGSHHKIQLYQKGVCAIATHGCVAWNLTERNCRAINGWNSSNLAVITGSSYRQEATANSSSFDPVADVRHKRLKHLGSTPRLSEHLGSTPRLSENRLYKNVVTILGPQEDGSYRSGSIFMDTTPHNNMNDLCAVANDKRGWASLIRPTLSKLYRREKEINAAAAHDRRTHQASKLRDTPTSPPDTTSVPHPHSPNLNIPSIL